MTEDERFCKISQVSSSQVSSWIKLRLINAGATFCFVILWYSSSEYPLTQRLKKTASGRKRGISIKLWQANFSNYKTPAPTGLIAGLLFLHLYHAGTLHPKLTLLRALLCRRERERERERSTVMARNEGRKEGGDADE